MANVSFHGTGLTIPLADQVGIGEGLQAGLTEVDFESGAVSLVDNSGHPTNIGRFVGLHGSDAHDGVVKSIVFKASVICTVIIDKMSYVYQNLNQWVTFNHVNTSRMQILRTPTGQATDVFDWDFNASDDPEYRLTIQNSDKTSQSETVFGSASRAVNTYTQVINLRGAKKIILQGQSPSSAETGVATVTLEVFDPASNQWNLLVPSQDIFTIAQGQSKAAEIGDTISKSPIQSQYGYIAAPVANGSPPGTNQTLGGTNSTSNGISALGSSVGHVLPTGDNVLRAKVVVATSSLTFTLSVTKVFD